MPSDTAENIELGSSSHSLSNLSEPLQPTGSARSLASAPEVAGSTRSPASVTRSFEADEAPVNVADKDSLIAELRKEEYGDWVEQVINDETRKLAKELGKEIGTGPGKMYGFRVWKGDDIGKVLAADDPKRWAIFSIALQYKGWQFLPYLHPTKFVWTGVDEEGKDYIHCRRTPTPESFQMTTDESSHSNWICCLCYGCAFVKAALGLILNMCWCVFGYVLPNCCCAWRWPCCQAPSSCCCRHYWPWSDLEPQVRTGDIFLFCGTFGTRIGGQSHWSHVGVALRDDEGKVGPKGMLYVYEANFGRPGWDHCDLRIMREKIITYKDGATDTAWRPLKLTEMQLDEETTRQKLTEAILHHCGCSYDHDMKHMFAAAVDCCPCFEVKNDIESGQVREMFCSQAVARVLQEAGVLPLPPAGPPSCEYLPRDFGLMPGCNDESRLLHAILGPLHMVQRTNYTQWTGMGLR